jgi:hypothetical protein
MWGKTFRTTLVSCCVRYLIYDFFISLPAAVEADILAC